MDIEKVLLVMGSVFVATGLGMAINIAWGLITGGPRARTEPGQPYLYDRLYYFLFLIMLMGWTIGLLSSLADDKDASDAAL